MSTVLRPYHTTTFVSNALAAFVKKYFYRAGNYLDNPPMYSPLHTRPHFHHVYHVHKKYRKVDRKRYIGAVTRICVTDKTRLHHDHVFTAGSLRSFYVQPVRTTRLPRVYHVGTGFCDLPSYILIILKYFFF